MRWESKDAIDGCSGAEGTFEIEDKDGKLEGDGKITLTDGAVCFDCRFDIEAKNKGDDEYDFDIEFRDCTVNGSPFLDWKCDFKDDELDCGNDAKPYDEWEKKE